MAWCTFAPVAVLLNYIDASALDQHGATMLDAPTPCDYSSSSPIIYADSCSTAFRA